MHLTRSTRGLFWIGFLLGALAIANEFFFRITIPIFSEIANIILLAIGFILLLLVAIFNRTKSGIFWVSLILGALAIVNEFFTKVTIPILSEIGNIVLLAIAFILLLIGILFRRH
jgi:hypothetical protein